MTREKIKRMQQRRTLWFHWFDMFRRVYQYEPGRARYFARMRVDAAFGGSR